MSAAGPRATGSVDLQGVSRRFGNKVVLEQLSFEVAPGGYVALVGPNGSGKTTVLRIVAGLLDPDSGDVRVSGGRPGQGQAGYLPAGDRGLHFRLTGGQNLEFFALAAGVERRSVGAALESASQAVGAESLLSTLVGECSTGQRRRLALAQAIIGGPPVLILDEPFADLDPQGITCVEQLVDLWRSRGGAVVAASPSERSLPPSAAVISMGAVL